MPNFSFQHMYRVANLKIIFGCNIKKFVTIRLIKHIIIQHYYRSINLNSFSNDILSSALFFSPPSTSLQSYLHLFNSTLLSVLDKHAPLKTVTCPARPKKPFITPEILSQKSKRSKLETIFRKS